MKYTTEIIINKSREDVIEVFEDSSLLSYWQRGLKRSRVIGGAEGEVGSKRKALYDNRRSIHQNDRNHH